MTDMKNELTLTRPDGGRVKIVTKLNTGNTSNTFKYVQNVFTCVAGSNEWAPVIDHTCHEYRRNIGNDKRLAYIAAKIAEVVTDVELYRAKMKLHDKIKPEPPVVDELLRDVVIVTTGMSSACRNQLMKRFRGSGATFKAAVNHDTDILIYGELDCSNSVKVVTATHYGVAVVPVDQITNMSFEQVSVMARGQYL